MRCWPLERSSPRLGRRVPASTACLEVQDGTHFSPKEQTEHGDYPYITAKNVRPWGLDLADLTYVDAQQHREIYQRSDVKPGDVLLVKDGVNAGDACINTLTGEASLLIQRPFSRDRDPALLKPGFLRYYLQSPQGNRQLRGLLCQIDEFSREFASDHF